MKLPNDLLQELSESIEKLALIPADDVKKNARALLQSSLGKLEMVSQEEFDSQARVLESTRNRVEQLERQVSELEKMLKDRND